MTMRYADGRAIPPIPEYHGEMIASYTERTVIGTWPNGKPRHDIRAMFLYPECVRACRVGELHNAWEVLPLSAWQPPVTTAN